MKPSTQERIERVLFAATKGNADVLVATLRNEFREHEVEVRRECAEVAHFACLNKSL